LGVTGRADCIMAALGLCAGFASWVGIFWLPNGILWWPGACFGLIVALPLAWRKSHRSLRLAGACVVGTISYFVAYCVQGQESTQGDNVRYVVAAGAAGAAGALLSGAGLLVVLGRLADFLVVLLMVVEGTVAGVTFGLMIAFLPNDNTTWPLKVLSGFVAWQSLTALPLGHLLDAGRPSCVSTVGATPYGPGTPHRIGSLRALSNFLRHTLPRKVGMAIRNRRKTCPQSPREHALGRRPPQPCE
jgi:hypothetical protein